MAVVGGSKVQIDASDPLFLHPSDHPGQASVTDIFNGEDFDDWRRSVRITLSAKQKLAFIDGTYDKPDSSSPLHPYWQRCNDMVISWLLNSLHKSIRDSVIYCNTASEIWKELNGRYGQSNKARHFQAQKEVSCISQGDLDIVSYFNKAKKIWDEFAVASGMPWCECKKCECYINGKLQNYLQEQKIIQFFMGLNESYTAVRGNIIMMSPLPSLGQIYSLLVQEERQRQVRAGVQFQYESTSFNVNIATNNGGSTVKNIGPRRQDGRKTNLFCEHCKRNRHTIDKCYKLHGYPGNNTNKLGGRGRFYRAANNAWGDSEEQTENKPSPSASSSTMLPGLNQEQTKQLLTFLSNLTSGTEAKSGEANVSAAHMAGPFSEEATGNW